VTVRPFIADDLASGNLNVRNVTTVDPSRTFWDKGQCVSRHYYDVSRLLASEPGRRAANDLEMAQDCDRHAKMFFNRPDFDLASAVPGSFTLTPHNGMTEILERDYEAMSGMIFGTIPAFKGAIASIAELEQRIKQPKQTARSF
jgi:hypothetical protein